MSGKRARLKFWAHTVRCDDELEVSDGVESARVIASRAEPENKELARHEGGYGELAVSTVSGDPYGAGIGFAILMRPQLSSRPP